MKAIAWRLRRLEDQFGPADGKPRKLLVVCNAGWGLALDRDTCIQVLDECGFLPTHGLGLVNLGEVRGLVISVVVFQRRLLDLPHLLQCFRVPGRSASCLRDDSRREKYGTDKCKGEGHAANQTFQHQVPPPSVIWNQQFRPPLSAQELTNK